jgi:hypothetical protein
MNFILGQTGRKTLSVMVLSLVRTVDYWLLTLDCRTSNVCCGTWTSFWAKRERKHCVLWCDRMWGLLTVHCRLSNLCCGTWTSFWENQEGKQCLLWCYHLWGPLTIDCRLSNACCGTWTSFWENRRENKRENIVCYGTVACEDCWLLTVECMLWDVNFILGKQEGKHCLLWYCRLWGLLTVDCRMHVVGRELHFGQNRRENIICYGAVACEDCWLLNVECWLLTIGDWLFAVDCRLWTVDCQMHVVGHELHFGQNRRENIVCPGAVTCEDCWLTNVCCGIWTSFWEKQEGKHYLLWCCRLWGLLTVDCPMHVVEHELHFGKTGEKTRGKTLSVMVLSLVRTADCRLLTVESWLSQMNCVLGKTRRQTRICYGLVACEDCRLSLSLPNPAPSTALSRETVRLCGTCKLTKDAFPFCLLYINAGLTASNNYVCFVRFVIFVRFVRWFNWQIILSTRSRESYSCFVCFLSQDHIARFGRFSQSLNNRHKLTLFSDSISKFFYRRQVWSFPVPTLALSV